MYKLEKLILVEVSEVKGKDDRTGNEYRTFKHEFMRENGDVVEGYSDNDGYKTFRCPVLEWVPDKARNFLWESKSFQGQVKWRLVERMRAEALLREMNQTV